MPGSRHFTVNAIRNDLPEKTSEIELEKWQKISYLLEEGEDEIPIENVPLRKIRLLKIKRNNNDKRNFLKCLSEGAALIKEYIKAEVADVYLVEDENVYRLLFKHGCPSTGAVWPVGPGTIVSAYVAYDGRNLILHERSNYYYHPLGTGRGLKPVHLICTPILNESGDCIAVFEFGMISENKKFTKAETNACSHMAAWLGQSATFKSVQYDSNIETYQSLFNALGRFQISHKNPEVLISDVLIIPQVNFGLTALILGLLEIK